MAALFNTHITTPCRDRERSARHSIVGAAIDFSESGLEDLACGANPRRHWAFAIPAARPATQDHQLRRCAVNARASHPGFELVQRAVAFAVEGEKLRVLHDKALQHVAPLVANGNMLRADAQDRLIDIAQSNGIYRTAREREDAEHVIEMIVLGIPSMLFARKLPTANGAQQNRVRSERAQESQRRASRSLIALRASEIKPEKIEWVWPGRIARGKHTTIAGDPSIGKSQVTIWIAAAVTTGGDLPCGEGRASLGDVIILSAEDGVADTIVPRLIAAGADRGRVHIVIATRLEDGKSQRTFSLQADIELLEQKIKELRENSRDVGLVIIDPVSAYMGQTDSHKNAEVRGALAPVSEMAERTRVAILSVTHFSKGVAGASTKALYRFIGSIAFTAAPRAAFVVMEDPDDKSRYLFLHGKNNLAAPPQGLAYRLEQRMIGEAKDILASAVAWEIEPVETTADEALGAGDSSKKAEPTAKEDAVGFLRIMLAAGPVKVGDIENEARAACLLRENQSIGQSKPFRSARKFLGITTDKASMDKGWVWALPKMPSGSEDAL